MTAKSKVCLVVEDATGQPLVLTHADSEAPRVFDTPKQAWQWAKRNIRSPKQRKKIFVVPAPRS